MRDIGYFVIVRLQISYIRELGTIQLGMPVLPPPPPEKYMKFLNVVIWLSQHVLSIWEGERKISFSWTSLESEYLYTNQFITTKILISLNIILSQLKKQRYSETLNKSARNIKNEKYVQHKISLNLLQTFKQPQDPYAHVSSLIYIAAVLPFLLQPWSHTFQV